MGARLKTDDVARASVGTGSGHQGSEAHSVLEQVDASAVAAPADWPTPEILSPSRTGNVHKSPVVSAEMELVLCRRWRDRHDIAAAHQLTGRYQGLVVMIATAYHAYNPASEELVGEGCVGLMRAVCRFDPDRGVRFGTYAIWWVHATILEYILRKRSFAKHNMTASQEKLFCNLRRMHGYLREFHGGVLESERASSIVNLPHAQMRKAVTINSRTASTDRSLNIPVSVDRKAEWQPWLVNDEGDDQKATFAASEETARQTSVLPSSLIELATRERHGPGVGRRADGW